ncbi:MAG: molybdopterin converting factor subunit 1 [Alphaproteobacteria bacterium]
MKLMYFAWMRQRIGTGQEDVALPEEVTTTSELIDWLAARGGGYAEAFKDRAAIKVAVDQEFAGFDTSIREAGEIAFFPPVTGG